MTSLPAEGYPFMRLHGCGNSFAIVSDLHNSVIAWELLARKVQDPHYGIGGDGFFVVRRSDKFNFRVDMYNPDGSPMGMCGNGIRCVVRYLYLEGLLDQDTRQVDFEVEGRHIVTWPSDAGLSVRVDMGSPAFDPKLVPLASSDKALELALEIEGEAFLVTALSMGNPHCVIKVPEVEKIDLLKIGPLIEHHQLFPKRANVEFVQVLAHDKLLVRVWERGAGATLACGTGACAAVVAGAVNKWCGRSCAVVLPGGELLVEYNQESDRVYLTGPAEEICHGILCPSLLQA